MSEQQTKERRFYCDFCGVESGEIPLGVMIIAFDTNVCNLCVQILAGIVWEWRHAEWLKYKDLAP